MARNIYIKCIAGATGTAQTVGGQDVNKQTTTLIGGDQQYLSFILLNEHAETGVTPATITGLSAARLIVRSGRYPGATLYAYQDAYIESTYGLDVINEVQPIAPVLIFNLDLATAAIVTALGNAASTTAWLEMSLTSSTGEETWFAEEITIANQLYDGGAVAPPSPSASYYTAAQVLALAQVHYDTAAVDLTTPAAHTVATVPTGKVFIVQALHRYNVAVTTPGTAESIKLGTNSDDDAIFTATALSYSTQGAVDVLTLAQPYAIAAGGSLIATITTGATSAAATGRYIAVGYLISA